MKTHLFETPAFQALERTLNEGSIRQRVISHNLANAETEGYEARRVVFREALQAAEEPGGVSLARTHPAHLGPGPGGEGDPRPYQLEKVPDQGLDQALVELVENSYLYNASARLMARKFDALLASVRGRSA